MTSLLAPADAFTLGRSYPAIVCQRGNGPCPVPLGGEEGGCSTAAQTHASTSTPRHRGKGDLLVAASKVLREAIRSLTLIIPLCKAAATIFLEREDSEKLDMLPLPKRIHEQN